jgi:outer membrane protein assembly factor BamB
MDVVEMIDVDLIEDDVDDEFLALLREIALEAIALRAHSPGDPHVEAPADAASEERAAERARRTRRRRIVRTAVIAAVVLAVAITPGVVTARRDAARLAALKASPEVLLPASSPPVEVWRTPGRVVGEQSGVLLVAGTPDGSLQRLDPATGAQVWTVTSPDTASIGRCFPVGDALGPDRGPAADPTAPQGLTACVAVAAAGPGTDATARVVVLDPGSGAVTQTVTVQGALLVAEAVDGDLLVAAALPDGRLDATRWDLGARAPSWRYTSASPVVTGGTWPAAELRADTLAVGDVAVDLTSGTERAVQEARRSPLRLDEHTLPGGARVTWWWYPNGEFGQGRVTSDHGTRVFALLGPPLVPAITDGSQAQTLVVLATGGDHLRGLDLRSGAIRWYRPYRGGPSARATAQVDGVMLLDDGAAVTAIAVRTGEPRWSVPVDSAVTGQAALTDAEVVLLPEPTADGRLELVARTIADGTRVWSAPIPAGTLALTVVDQRLVAWTGDDVVGLG